MFKCRGFKVTFSVSSKNKSKHEVHEIKSVAGCYRANKDEYFEKNGINDQLRQTNNGKQNLTITNDLSSTKTTHTRNKNINLYGNNNSVNAQTSSTINTALNKTEQTIHTKSKSKEEKRLEKEKKTAEKLAAQQRVKEDKLRKQKEKELLQQRERQQAIGLEKEHKSSKTVNTIVTTKENNVTKSGKSSKKSPAPRPLSKNPLHVPNEPLKTPSNPLAGTSRYSTNTLESSISKSSGPPPYTEEALELANQSSKSKESSNVSFGKPIEDSSWDLISQHRQQMTRPTMQPVRPRTLDLQYTVGKSALFENVDKENTDA